MVSPDCFVSHQVYCYFSLLRVPVFFFLYWCSFFFLRRGEHCNIPTVMVSSFDDDDAADGGNGNDNDDGC